MKPSRTPAEIWAEQADRRSRLAAYSEDMLKALEALLAMPVIASMPFLGSGPVDEARKLIMTAKGEV